VLHHDDDQPHGACDAKCASIAARIEYVTATSAIAHHKGLSQEVSFPERFCVGDVSIGRSNDDIESALFIFGPVPVNGGRGDRHLSQMME